MGERCNGIDVDAIPFEYVNGRASLHYDFGAYTAAPRVEGRDGVTETVWIGGRRAELVGYRRSDGRFVVKAWWRAVSEGVVGTNHLWLSAEFERPADRATILASIYSVRFD